MVTTKFKIGDVVYLAKNWLNYETPMAGGGEVVEILLPSATLGIKDIRYKIKDYFAKTYFIFEEDLELVHDAPVTDTTAKQEGIKHDQQKAPMDLLPYESLEEIAKVLGFGATKYERANWARGIKQSRLISAALRHIGQFNNGEDKDPETNTLHIANAACNLLFAIWMYKNRPDMDDRWVKVLKNENNS